MNELFQNVKIISFVRGVQTFWNWIDLFLLLLSIMACVFQVLHNSAGDNLLQKIGEYPIRFVNISQYIYFKTNKSAVTSVLAFCLTIRILRALSVSRKFSVFLEAVSIMKTALFSFIPLFLIVIFAFSDLFALLFETRLSQFNSLGITVLNLLIYAFFPRTLSLF